MRAANLDVLDWELPAEDFKAISSLARQERMVTCKFWLNPRGPYKTSKDFWDE